MDDPASSGELPALPFPPPHPERLVYLGTPEMAVPPLRALHAAGFEIVLVVTGSDKRRGRRGEPTPTPVKAAALELGIPVSHELGDIEGARADLGVVVAFGRILKRSVLDVVPMVNLHFSLLPRWRGAAPVQRALLAGDDRTGVCVMAVEDGLDTGGIYARAELPIGPTATADELSRDLTELGSQLLVDTLRAGLAAPVPQDGATTYAEKLGPDDLYLDWARPAAELDRIVRVGGAWTTFRGRRFKVGRVELVSEPAPGAPGSLRGDCVVAGEGQLRLVQVQPEGKAPIAFADWVNGARPAADELLGREEVAS